MASDGAEEGRHAGISVNNRRKVLGWDKWVTLVTTKEEHCSNRGDTNKVRKLGSILKES